MLRLFLLYFIAFISINLFYSSGLCEEKKPVGNVVSDTDFFSRAGTQVAAGSLANSPIGQYGAQISLRFQAQSSGLLNSIKTYWIYKNSPGYHAGTGGKIKISLHEETSAHLPASKEFGFAIFDPKIPTKGKVGRSKRFVEIRFSKKGTIVKGRRYHLVFKNIATDPEKNWISVNALLNRSGTFAALPTTNWLNWSLLRRYGSTGDWKLRNGYVPILALNVQSKEQEKTFGVGYMEVWTPDRHHHFLVHGSQHIRQAFKSDKVHTFNKIFLQVGRYSGSGPLKVEVQQADGSVLGSKLVDTSVLPMAEGRCAENGRHHCHRWLAAEFSESFKFEAGKEYLLQISSSEDSKFGFNLLRQGSYYGFPSATYVEGVAEISKDKGKTWFGVTVWKQSDRKEGNLPFYLGD